mmetsp:Transcript_54784/g.82933  ORF Transcript_54784/g.82933 Transcript_54784/m.82933 type:complete len:374 (+) Transcript_54784:105-1226(+)|eukprot:CAMPEP_0117034358 /NCGR_PEP_ID=MMETSP0472-20121206/24468_1 /TAXON_ID=693140 ORGANISM="Tiarina fusus, Strain LIS" /NCGR_SAMPLE_ID=MMETSP0472 /ASSEMBLY_ACC=CAM_ASM_000603 /LENGTH=373 /DNA_ID=CAMNT_0004743507 /DNA_START=158 /DNA_END=1279 /DNA_ORIENTATION=+
MRQTIISLANARFSVKPQNSNEIDDRLDAARALLGVSPSSVAENNGPESAFGGRGSAKETAAENDFRGRSRSDSVGLDALAFCATNEQATLETPTCAVSELTTATVVSAKPLVTAAVCSSSDDDSESMPPPPPRTVTRRRSVSNPEGMERWAPKPQSRLHLVLPASILEEELAEANAAMKAKEEATEAGDTAMRQQECKEEEEEEFLDEAELLRRARSRLLEDLSQGNLTGEKGVLTLPHSLEKYKEVYNRNGRIGIYTPAERVAIINRFQSKRTRRVWNKKIRYNCRKNLADRRMRVKGRFVKRSTEQQAKVASTQGSVIPEGEEATFVSADALATDESNGDEEMPDVTDPDAGFCPTDDQPFRRVRRHTIT